MRCWLLLLIVFSSVTIQGREDVTSSISDLLREAQHIERFDPDSSISIYQKAYWLAVDQDSMLAQAKAIYYIGSVLLDQGQLDSSETFFNRAIDSFEAMGDSEYLCKVLVALANKHNFGGSYEKALMTYQRAYDQAAVIGDPLIQARILSNQSSIFNITGRIASALSVLERAEELAQPLGETSILADIYNNFSLNHQANGNYELAAAYGIQAVDIYHAVGDDLYEALALTNLSSYLHEKAPMDLEGSKNSLDRSRTILDTIQAPYIEVNYYKHLAYYYYKSNHFVEAEKAARKCLDFLEAYPHRKSEGNIYEILYGVCKAQNKVHEALLYHEKYMAIRDSLVFQENRNQLQELQIKYEASKKDGEIANQQLTINRRTSQRNLLTSGLVLVVLAVWFVISQYRKDRKLASERIQNLEKYQKILVMDSMLQGQEEERKRIAKDLHDGLGSVLAAARIQMRNIQLEIDKLGELRLVNKTESLIDHACKEVRRIAHDMMPIALIDLGFCEAIHDLVDDLQLREQLLVDLRLPEKMPNLDNAIALNIYRIIQELLQNVLRHAHANILELHIERSDDALILTIADDGVGFDVRNSAAGLGLQSIRSRVNYLNGTLALDTGPDSGSRFRIHIPDVFKGPDEGTREALDHTDD